MKVIIRILKINELLKFIIYYYLRKVVNWAEPSEKLKNIIYSAKEADAHNLYFKRHSDDIIVSNISADDRYRYAIRPGTADFKVLNQVLLLEEYSYLIEILEREKEIDKIKILVDAGSNIGLSSFYFLKKIPSISKIISIEADFENFEQQKKNIKLNNESRAIQAIRRALWINDNECLKVSSDFRDGDTWSKSVSEILNHNLSKNETVESISLSSVLKLLDTDCLIDVLKIDIEGAEKKLFCDRDFLLTLQRSVRFLCIEIHDESEIDVIDILENINFKSETIGETTFSKNLGLI